MWGDALMLRAVGDVSGERDGTVMVLGIARVPPIAPSGVGIP